MGLDCSHDAWHGAYSSFGRMVGEHDDIRRCIWCEMALARTPAPVTQTTANLSAALGALYDVDGERLLALALDDLDRHADTIRKAQP